MKKLLLSIFTLVSICVYSQNLTIKERRVTTVVTQQGDTLVQFKLKDAKIILADLLDKEYVDSLLVVYQEKDSISDELISIKTEQIRLLQEKGKNYEGQVANLEKVIKNKDSEVSLLNEDNKKLKKEVRKQKFLKVLGYIGSVALPIITALLIL